MLELSTFIELPVPKVFLGPAPIRPRTLAEHKAEDAAALRIPTSPHVGLSYARRDYNFTLMRSNPLQNNHSNQTH